MTEERGPDQTVSVPGLESARAFGTPHVTTSATLSWLVDGFIAARARLRAAAAGYPPDVRATFQPLFEALNWAATIDDYANDKQRGGRPFDDDVLAGVRFARNRVHHQWADALEPEHAHDPPDDDRRARGEEANLSLWFWKAATLLPEAPPRYADPKGEQAYRDHLEGRAADEALEHLEQLFRARLAASS